MKFQKLGHLRWADEELRSGVDKCFKVSTFDLHLEEKLWYVLVLRFRTIAIGILFEMWIEALSPIGVETPRRGVSTRTSATLGTTHLGGLYVRILTHSQVQKSR